MSKQLRNFVFTVNNPTQEDENNLQELGYQYLVYGQETGESGTPHLQGYCELTCRRTFVKLKEILPTAHIEVRRGSQTQAITYCKKTGLYREFGKPRCQGSRSDITAIRQFVSEGNSLRNVIESEGEITLNGNTLRIAEKLFKYYEPARDYKPLVYWFHGSSGIGKTKLARQLLPNAYFFSGSTGKWWPGYDGHTDIIIDDIRAESISFVSLIGMIDRFPYSVEDKGTIRQFKGLRIIITSPESPRMTYIDSPEDHTQLLRRIDDMFDFDDDPLLDNLDEELYQYLQNHFESRGVVLPPTSDY